MFVRFLPAMSFLLAMMGHPACAAKFWIYWVFTFLTLSFFTFYGQMTVAISPNVQVSPSSPAWNALSSPSVGCIGPWHLPPKCACRPVP